MRFGSVEPSGVGDRITSNFHHGHPKVSEDSRFRDCKKRFFLLVL